MRALFSTCPEVGHLFPLVPLARALVAAGHAVRFAVAPGLIPRVEAAGFAAVAVGRDFGDWWAELHRRLGDEPGRGLAPDEVVGWFTPNLFAAVGAPTTLADLAPLVADWRPDLIIHDSFEFAAPLAAAAAGIPSVQHTLGPLPAPGVFRAVGEVLAPHWRAAGLQPEPFAGIFRGLTLAIAPPGLEADLPAEARSRVRPLRPVGYDAAPEGDAPEWLAALPPRPTIYGTLGTFLNTDLAIFRAMLDGLAGEPLNLILTVGRNNDPAALAPLPPNARVERFIPQSFLLPHCAAVVCHGGSGTLLPALGRGLPLVLVPQGADNFDNARRCVAAGVALALLPGQVTAAAIHDAVRAVLRAPRYADRARRVAAEIAAMPLPEQVIPVLEALVRG